MKTFLSLVKMPFQVVGRLLVMILEIIMPLTPCVMLMLLIASVAIGMFAPDPPKWIAPLIAFCAFGLGFWSSLKITEPRQY